MVERLGGMSGSRVLRVRGERGRAVVKGGAKAAETEFYEVIAPILAARGAGVPELLWAGVAGDERWLIIEEVPTPLPRERWGPDPEVLAALARIHSARRCPAALALRRCVPAGSGRRRRPALAMEALVSPGGGDLGEVAALLAGMQVAAAPLFAPVCPLSGDPNPANWGLRTDGSLVLFDWERFCRGTPALDLAAIVPGLGTPEEFAAVAGGYLAARTRLVIRPRRRWTSPSLRARSRWRRRGTWSSCWRGSPPATGARSRMLDWLRGSFPEWVRACGTG